MSQSKISFKKNPGLTDCGMATDILVENDFKKNKRNPVCETLVWPLVDWVKNLIGKKRTLSVGQQSGLWRVKHEKTNANVLTVSERCCMRLTGSSSIMEEEPVDQLQHLSDAVRTLTFVFSYLSTVSYFGLMSFSPLGFQLIQF